MKRSSVEDPWFTQVISVVSRAALHVEFPKEAKSLQLEVRL